MELDAIQKLLDDDDFETKLDRADGDAKTDRLLVAIHVTDDENEDPLVLEMAYVPGLEDELDETKLLQCYVALDDVIPSALDEARRLLTHLNLNLPLMAFNLHEEGQFFYFRHVLMLAKQEGPHDGDVVKESVWMTNYLIATFRNAIRSVASGEATTAQLLNQ